MRPVAGSVRAVRAESMQMPLPAITAALTPSVP